MKQHLDKNTRIISQQEHLKTNTSAKTKAIVGTDTRKDPRSGYAEPQLTKDNFNKGRNPRKR